MVFSDVTLAKTTKQVKISCTQEQYAMNGDTVQEVDVLTLQSRDPARAANVKDYLKNPQYATDYFCYNPKGKLFAKVLFYRPL